MKISDQEIQKALKIRNAIQTYLERTKEVNIRSTDVFPYLVRKGIFVEDKNNGLFFRRFLKKLYQANMLHSLIPQCKYVPGIKGEIFGEWYFNTHKPETKNGSEVKFLEEENDQEKLVPISFEDARNNLFQLIEGINPETGKEIFEKENPLLFKICQSLRVFIEHDAEEKPENIQNNQKIAEVDNFKTNKKTRSSEGLIENRDPAYSIDEIRKSHENAYKPWTPEEEKFLTELFEQGLTIKEIARKMKRQNGGVRSRLRKLGRKVK